MCRLRHAGPPGSDLSRTHSLAQVHRIAASIVCLLRKNGFLPGVAPSTPWTSPEVSPILGLHVLNETDWGRAYLEMGGTPLSFVAQMRAILLPAELLRAEKVARVAELRGVLQELLAEQQELNEEVGGGSEEETTGSSSSGEGDRFWG